MNSAASSSAEPPISPIMHDGVGLRVGLELGQAVDEEVPGTGSPPMPTQVDTPMPFCFSSYSAW